MISSIAKTNYNSRRLNQSPVIVVIVGSTKLFSLGIKSVFDNTEEASLCASFFTCSDLLDWYNGKNADVILIDIAVADSDASIRKLFDNYTNIKIALISNQSNRQVLVLMRTLGVKAFLPYSIEPEELIPSLLKVHEGGEFFPQIADLTNPGTGLIKNNIPGGILTEREIEVLKLMVIGKKNREMAVEMNISPLTVKKHRENILRKLGAANTAQVILNVNFEAFFRAYQNK